MLNMEKICLILSLIVCISSAQFALDRKWQDFKTKYKKHYPPEEDVRRREIFAETIDKIGDHNTKYAEGGSVTFTMGINKFADMLPEEMNNYSKGLKNSADILSKSFDFFAPEEGVDYPDSVDWRRKGYVTPVKDQNDCGASWAFSATGSLEGQNFKKSGKLVSLSEQNLVDCVRRSGCGGGYMAEAFHYVKNNKGIDTEESYPYIALDLWCKYDPKNIGGTCSGFKVIQPGKEDDLMAAVATVGPISVAVDGNPQSFKFYSGGVYYEPKCNSTYTNHGALVVGYGVSEGKEYWLVKNSWGTDWGINGYIMMARNRKNNCGIASGALYPQA